eukprot:jgi/Psemu1/302183/fgenesh1_kg.60_\
MKQTCEPMRRPLSSPPRHQRTPTVQTKNPDVACHETKPNQTIDLVPESTYTNTNTHTHTRRESENKDAQSAAPCKVFLHHDQTIRIRIAERNETADYCSS